MVTFQINGVRWMVGFALGCSVLLTPFAVSHAFVDCTFSRVLSDGDEGEDIQCLQEFLNDAGFTIAEAGPGAPGNETTQFRALTKNALIRWQESKSIAPATGAFGPQSQAAYLLTRVASLETEKEQLAEGVVTPPVPTGVVAGVSTSATKPDEALVTLFSSLFRTLSDTIDQFDEVDEEVEALELREDLDESYERLFDAVRALLATDYRTARADATEAHEIAIDILEDAGGESLERKAEDVLDDAFDRLADIEELFEEADDEGVKTGDAEEYIDEARDLLEDAEAAYDERNYRQAISDAYDAEELLEEAESEIDLLSDNDIAAMIADLWDEYDDVEVEIEEADEDGEEIEEAEEYLKEAEKLLKRADNELDIDDYPRAQRYAEEAEEQLDEARDAIGESSDDEADEAEEALNDAWDEYEDVKDAIEEADSEGENVSEAEDYLDEAEDALDDEDYDEVMDLVDEALDLLKDAEDEL